MTYPDSVIAAARRIMEEYGYPDVTREFATDLYEAMSAAMWQDIESAPKGGGARLVTDPDYVDPPDILLRFPGGQQRVASWDWFYADGGDGCTDGVAWVESIGGERVHMYYENPTHWQPLPVPLSIDRE